MRIFWIACIILANGVANSLGEPTPSPSVSVVDYYLALPDSMAGDVTHKAREKALKKAVLRGSEPIVDLRNGTIGAYVTPMMRMTAALFPTRNGEPVLGIVHQILAAADQPRFYQRMNGKWMDVTERVLPKGTYPRFGFQLPRIGTTLDVYDQHEGTDGFELGTKLRFKLRWDGERFEKVR